MGGANDSMRYTEREYNFEFTSLSEWLQNILGVIIVAPLRFCNEISSKIVYLKRDIIERILFLAVLLQIIIIGVTAILQSYFSDISADRGKVPILLQLIVLAFTCLGFCFYKFYNISIYAQLNHILPVVGSVPVDDAQDHMDYLNLDTPGKSEFPNLSNDMNPISTPLTVNDLENINIDINLEDFNDTQIGGQSQNIINPFKDNVKSDKSQKIANSEVDLSELGISEELQGLVNLDLVNDEDVIEYQNSIMKIPDKVEQPHIDSMDLIEDQMEKASEENRYIPEKNLTGFLKEIGADSFGLFDSIESWAVVDSLTN